ncbi:hypothetical protein JYT83_00665 [bacterium AH-315-F18]|nr:hypothetical protein [bacterium AH-315-F18]
MSPLTPERVADLARSHLIEFAHEFEHWTYAQFCAFDRAEFPRVINAADGPSFYLDIYVIDVADVKDRKGDSKPGEDCVEIEFTISQSEVMITLQADVRVTPDSPFSGTLPNIDLYKHQLSKFWLYVGAIMLITIAAGFMAGLWSV